MCSVREDYDYHTPSYVEYWSIPQLLNWFFNDGKGTANYEIDGCPYELEVRVSKWDSMYTYKESVVLILPDVGKYRKVRKTLREAVLGEEKCTHHYG